MSLNYDDMKAVAKKNSSKSEFFDWNAFADAIRGKMSWDDTLEETASVIGIDRSTLHSATKAKPLSLNSVAAICTWLGRRIDDFRLAGEQGG